MTATFREAVATVLGRMEMYAEDAQDYDDDRRDRKDAVGFWAADLREVMEQFRDES